MSPSESPVPGTRTKPPRHAGPTWVFALSFAVIGFWAGGWVAFRAGLEEASPPPPPPGGGNCGNAVLGGLFLIYVGTPLAAGAAALVAGGIGALVDCVLDRCRRTLVRSDFQAQQLSHRCDS